MKLRWQGFQGTAADRQGVGQVRHSVQVVRVEPVGYWAADDQILATSKPLQGNEHRRQKKCRQGALVLGRLLDDKNALLRPKGEIVTAVRLVGPGSGP